MISVDGRPGQLLFRILILGRPGQRTRHTWPSFLSSHWALPKPQFSIFKVCSYCLTMGSCIEDDQLRRLFWPITLPNFFFNPSWPTNLYTLSLFAAIPLAFFQPFFSIFKLSSYCLTTGSCIEDDQRRRPSW